MEIIRILNLSLWFLLSAINKNMCVLFPMFLFPLCPCMYHPPAHQIFTPLIFPGMVLFLCAFCLFSCDWAPGNFLHDHRLPTASAPSTWMWENGWTRSRGHWLRITWPWIPVPALPLPGCTSLSKSFNSPVQQFRSLLVVKIFKQEDDNRRGRVVKVMINIVCETLC